MSRRIILVEDSTFDQKRITQVLEKGLPDHTVEVVATGEECIELLSDQDYDLVLLDYWLPGISGLEVLKWIRAQDPDLPVILCTGETDKGIVLQSVQAGCTAYLIKDKNFFSLLPITVEKALRRDALEREKQSAVARLQESRDRYERLVTRSQDIMFQAAEDGRILYINPAVRRHLGVDPREFYEVPQRLMQLIHADDRQAVKDFFSSLWNGGGDEKLTFRMVSKLDRTLWFELSARVVDQDPTREDSQRVLLGEAHDVTGRKTLEADLAAERDRLQETNTKLEEINRVKSEFLANMSHELRTPMNSIIGYTDCLLDGLDGPLNQDQTQSLMRVKKNGEHLLNLINDILDLAKLESGKTTLNKEEFPIAQCVEDAVIHTEAMIGGKDLELVIDADETVMVRADKDKVTRILINLVSNAIKFTSRGHVAVRCQRDPRMSDTVKLEVEDTGIGMSTEDLTRIFEDFQQIDGSSSRKYAGTGLGLAITKKLVELHGGRIWVESTEGKGSLFHVLLPVALLPSVEKQLASIQRPFVAPASPTDGSGEDVAPSEIGPLVLAIDREVDMLNLLRKVLRAEGYRVVTTDDPEEGLHLARELHPFAITMDLMTSRSDGLMVMAGLKDDKVTRDIPVIVITIVDDAPMILDLGATDCLAKPFQAKVLLQKIRNLQGTSTEREILVVDDEPDVRQLYSDILDLSGYTQVRLATNGQEALDEIRKKRPDLVLMDLIMPIKNGFDTISELRADPRFSDLPIIVITGKMLTSQEEDFLEKHVKRVVTKKSVERQMLSDGLRAILKGMGKAVPGRGGAAKLLLGGDLEGSSG